MSSSITASESLFYMKNFFVRLRRQIPLSLSVKFISICFPELQILPSFDLIYIICVTPNCEYQSWHKNGV